MTFTVLKYPRLQTMNLDGFAMLPPVANPSCHQHTKFLIMYWSTGQVACHQETRHLCKEAVTPQTLSVRSYLEGRVLRVQQGQELSVLITVCIPVSM